MSEDTSSIAVMAVELKYIKEAVERIEKAGHNAVPRTEWEQRGTYVDEQFRTLWKEHAALKGEIASKRAPWWAIAASLTAITSIAIQLMQIVK